MSGRARAIGIALFVAVLAACSSSASKSGAPPSTSTKPAPTTSAAAKCTPAGRAHTGRDEGPGDRERLGPHLVRRHEDPHALVPRAGNVGNTPRADRAHGSRLGTVGRHQHRRRQHVGRGRDRSHVDRLAVEGRVQRVDLGPAGIRSVDRDRRGRQRTVRRLVTSPSCIDWVAAASERDARRPERSAARDGRRLVRRRNSDRHRRDRLPGRRDRSGDRMALARDESLQGRYSEERLGIDPHRRDERPVGRSRIFLTPTRRASPPASSARKTRPGSRVADPAISSARITIPTLIVQGTVDNLFTLDEGIQNYRILRDHGVPTAMMWFCGGHGVCLTDPGIRTAVRPR